MWCTLEIFKDPVLLSRVRTELEKSFSSGVLADVNFPVQTLLTLPLPPIYLRRNAPSKSPSTCRTIHGSS